MKPVLGMIVLLGIATAGWSQQVSGKKEAAENKAARERERSFGGHRTENELKDERGQVSDQVPADTTPVVPQHQEVKPVTTGVVSGNKDANANPFGSGNQPSNAPAVIQATSSEAGSPSTHTYQSGRDGTNTQQRGTYRMAGAELPPDMNLERVNLGEQNTGDQKIRRQEEQPQQTATPTDTSNNRRKRQQER